MPIYEYYCPMCGATAERIEPIGGPAKLPRCDAAVHRERGGVRPTMRRRQSVPAPAQFKGGGFHKNDYPSE